MSAYVEIIFDNSDDRFPTGKDELILRRTIGLKKDEYSLDRKNATKADVMNLLESAGFSRSNPYYIVPQGRVTTITNMKDSERLLLLKDVAGTQVYEARRTESLRIMTETNNKRQKIDELLDYINERLGELEEEKDELRDFQEKDRERRCLEYTIYSREQQEITSALETIEQQREGGVESTDANRDRFMQGENDMAQINSQISELKQQIELLKLDKSQFEDERRSTARARAQIELNVNNVADGQTAAQQAKARHDAELQRVQDLIRQREKELGQITPQYDAQKQFEEEAKAQLDEAETARNRLYAKQGRNARFRSKRERDEWLQEQINDGYAQLSKVKAVKSQTSEDVRELEDVINQLGVEIESVQEQISGRGNVVSELEQQIQSAKEGRDSLMDQRKELWREEAKLDAVLKNAQDELSRAERFLSQRSDGAYPGRALAAVRRIAQQNNLSGVYGTLGELIEVPDRYRLATEVIGGQSLFHVVVDNDDTATKVLETLNKERSGRVTFMPLNRLRSKIPNFPQANDALPLIQKLHYDQQYERAVQQVFGKTIICPGLEVASQYARSHGVTAITPDGQRSDKKGAVTGGYHDPRSVIDAIRNITRWRQEYETKRARGSEIQRELQRMDQRVTKAIGELQKLEQQKQQAQGNQSPMRQELRSKIDMLKNKKGDLESKQRAEANITANAKSLSDQQTAHESELQTEFKKALTSAEESQLEHLGTALPDLRKEYASASAARSDHEAQKSIIEVELDENLRPLLEQLKVAETETAEASVGNLKDLQRELKRITKALDSLEQRIHEVAESIEIATSQVAELEARNVETRRQQEDLAKAIERHQRRMEKSTQKRAALQSQAKSCSESIRDLGVLPEEAFTKYKNNDSNSIVKRLHKVNEALKKYSHVNKKAFEQYNNFTKQRQTLIGRREELEASQKSIEELIEVLDQRKDEAIERTFKQVSKEFATVFEKLVPAGKGRLVIQRKTDTRTQGNEDVDSDEEQARRKSVENYTGVGISVSFNSKHDDQQRIQQLSGGQKSKQVTLSIMGLRC